MADVEENYIKERRALYKKRKRRHIISLIVMAIFLFFFVASIQNEMFLGIRREVLFPFSAGIMALTFAFICINWRCVHCKNIIGMFSIFAKTCK